MPLSLKEKLEQRCNQAAAAKTAEIQRVIDNCKPISRSKLVRAEQQPNLESYSANASQPLAAVNSPSAAPRKSKRDADASGSEAGGQTASAASSREISEKPSSDLNESTPRSRLASLSSPNNKISPKTKEGDDEKKELNLSDLKSIKIGKKTSEDRRGSESSNSKKITTGRRPTKKMKRIRIDHRGEDFYDTSYYDKNAHGEKFQRSTLSRFLTFERLAKEYINDRKPRTLNLLRSELHKVEFFIEISTRLVKESKVLAPGRGLLLIIDDSTGAFNTDETADVVADAKALYYRWKVGDVSPDLLRGIIKSHGQATSNRIDQAWINQGFQHPSTCRGAGNFQIGQWWPLQICLVRDGAHGSPQAGISGKAKDGAYSIVVSGGGGENYEDSDHGDVLKYTGTPGELPDQPTDNTKAMKALVGKGLEVRVFRAAGGKSKWAPEIGLRYDGVYTVEGEELLDPLKSHWRFDLRRVAGQAPIRHKGLGLDICRPSRPEVEQHSSMEKAWRQSKAALIN